RQNAFVNYNVGLQELVWLFQAAISLEPACPFRARRARSAPVNRMRLSGATADFLMTSGGVPVGTSNPCQEPVTKSGTPLSMTVGSSGSGLHSLVACHGKPLHLAALDVRQRSEQPV